MNIYKYLSYSDFIKSFLESKKGTFPKWTQKKLARLSGIQESYFSNVLKSKASLNQDQIFRVAGVMNLDSEATDYLLLLGDLQDCSDHLRREHLLKKVEEFKKKNLKSEVKLGAQAPAESTDFYVKYYSDPYIKVIHVALAISKYRKTPKLLVDALDIPIHRVEKALAILEEIGVLEINKEGVEIKKKGFHLPEDHPLIWSHQTLLRQLSITHTANQKPTNKYSFSVTLSCERKTKDIIKNKLLEALKEIQGDVKDAKSEEVYQLNIDLFPWLK